MTNIDSLAEALFGSKRAETQEVLTDATTRTYIGTALTDSVDGTVMVDLGGDVTLPDDIEGVSEHSAEGVEVATGPGVRAGDEVVVTLVGGTPLKTPMVTGVAGEGDGQDARIATASAAAEAAWDWADEAHDAATDAQASADSAASAASAAVISAASAEASAQQAISDAAAASTAAASAEASAQQAIADAASASSSAASAQASAQQAISDANDAHDAAVAAQAEATLATQSANEAKGAATRANTAANDALTQLATVEDVIGVVDWVTEHGTYSLTTDTAIDPDKVYYTRTGSGTQADPYVYTAVAEPDVSDIGTYYELDIDEALSQYVASHLALTNAGLYVLKDSSGYKLLLANDGMQVIDPAGHTVATYGESITFDSERPQRIGGTDSYIEWRDTDNDGVPDSLAIVADSIELSGGQSVSTGSGNVWANHSSATSASGISSWSDTFVAPTTAKPYVWMKSYSIIDGQRVYGNPACITGAKGTDGTSVTVTSIEYATSTTETQPSSGWSTTAPSTVPEGSWLWTRVNYSDGSTAVSRAKQGQSGTSGSSSYTHVRYSAQSDGTGFVTTPTASTIYIGIAITTSSTAPTSKGSYTWSRYVGQQGAQGPQGETGDTGVGIQSYAQMWAKSTSSSVAPTSGWSASRPTSIGTNEHLWVRIDTTWTDNTTTQGTPVVDQNTTDLWHTSATLRVDVDSIDSDVSALQTTVSGHTTTISQHTTAIQQNSDAIALKANSSDVYTKTAVDGKITQEVSDRNAAITAKANEITTTVSQTYTTKQESKQAIDYVSNAESNYGFQYHKDIIVFGDSDKYYPVYFTNNTSQTVTHEVMVMRNYNEQAPDDWNRPTHKGSLNLCIRWNFGGWGGADYKAEITVFSEMYSTMLGDVMVGADNGMFSIVFLRGGGTVGALYHVYSEVPFWRHPFMQNAGVVGENDVPYVGLTEGTVYAKSGNYQWSVRAPLTAPNTTHINQLYTVQRVIEAESSIVQTANEITSTVSKISSAKYLNTTYSGYSLDQLRSYSAEGYTGGWQTTDAKNARVGDTVYLRVKDTTRDCYIYVKATVNSVYGNYVNCTSHGYEDVLPVDTIKSTINQSSDSVKIQAKHVEIDGTAVFSAISSDVDDAITSKGYQTSSQVNSAITSKGYATTTQAQGYASTAKSEAISAAATDATTKANAAENNAKAYTDALEIGGRNLLPKTGSADGYYANTVPSGNHLTTVNDDGECYERSVTSTSANIPMSSNVAIVGLESGSEYTLSMMVKSTVARTFGLQLRKNNNGADGGEYVYQPGVNVAANTWTRLTYSFTGASDAAVYARLYCAAGTACTVRMRELQLERGNKVTDWSPAPEDVAADIAAAQATANAAAPKANAVKRTQRIWYRKSASGAPSTPGTASSNWVTKADDGNDAWTKMHIAISSTHKYIYTCEQYEMANGTVGYTSVLLDNTITVIDGGNIITGSVTANKLNAANINASKTLTVGAMTDAAASSILNSNVQVGGRNLLLAEPSHYNQTSYDAYTIPSSTSAAELGAETTLTIQFWDVELDSNSSGIGGYWGGGSSGQLFLVKPDADGYCSVTFTIQATTASHSQGANKFLALYNLYNGHSGMSLSIGRWKLEKGNKATDWTPAPEDMATAESLAGTNESLEGAITDIGELSDQLVGTVSEQNKTITDIQTYLNSLRKDLDAEIQSRQQWLNFNSAEGLVIGAAGSTFKTVTTNTSQQFRSGGTVLAETSGTEFVAPVMRSDQLLIGNWMWTRRDNGNLSLKWIG